MTNFSFLWTTERKYQPPPLDASLFYRFGHLHDVTSDDQTAQEASDGCMYGDVGQWQIFTASVHLPPSVYFSATICHEITQMFQKTETEVNGAPNDVTTSLHFPSSSTQSQIPNLTFYE